MKYELDRLGWHSFQQLCHTILREVLGQTVQSFLNSNDAGRDGAFTGIWEQQNGEDLQGQFVFQCKFTERKDYKLKIADINDELRKTKILVERGICDCYILITNAGVSGKKEEDVCAKFKSLGVKKFKIYGFTWLCQQISENKRLRMLVPRIYGLGDLSQIIDERAYDQAKALLSSMKEDLAKVVITKAYQKAVDALNNHGFVLLIGEPAAGKTTIASLLAIASVDNWKALTMKLNEPAEVKTHWNPHERNQFFWIDDAFGITQYERSLAMGWNHIIPQIKAILEQGSKIVMTSRDYIYNRARKDIKESAFPLIQESQVVINVKDLSLQEKQQILYNHLKLGKQSTTFKKSIKKHLEFVSKLERFIPEIARRLSDPVFTKDLSINEYSLKNYVNEQRQILQDIFKGLDFDSKAVLALIYMRNGSLLSPLNISNTEKNAIERLGSNIGGVTNALQSLNGSMVIQINSEDSLYWIYKHPTIGDAFADLLAVESEMLEIYLIGSPVEKLVDQITCGDMELTNAVIISKQLFQIVIDRLSKFKEDKNYKSKYISFWGAQAKLNRFLSHRCSKEFLSMYLEQNPVVENKLLDVNHYLDYASEVELAIRLHENGLLSEKIRKDFVSKVSGFTLAGLSFFVFENELLKKLFTNEEFDQLQIEFTSKTIPDLGKVSLQ